MDPEKNGGAGGGETEQQQSGDGGKGEPEADQTTPLRHQEANYAQNNFMARSTRIRMAASQMHQGGPAGVYALMCGTLCCSFIIAIAFLVLLNIVSVTSIIIGAVHLNDCPAQPHIPVMLIALGVIAFVIGIFDGMDRAKDRRASQGGGVVIEDADDIKKPSCYTCINSVLKTIQLVLFVYTCVIVYRIFSTVTYTPVEDLNEAAGQDNHYCNAVAYLFAFWFLTATLVVLGAVLIFLLCICICAGALLVAASTDPD
jgi:hypothetical protein